MIRSDRGMSGGWVGGEFVFLASRIFFLFLSFFFFLFVTSFLWLSLFTRGVSGDGGGGRWATRQTGAERGGG